MYLKLNGIEMCCTGAERWVDLLGRLPDGGVGALGVSVQGRTYSLAEPVVEYAYAHVLTYADEEGRRIYERSLQLLFLTAVNHLFRAKVRIQHSFGQGLYIDVEGFAPDAGNLMRIENEMRAMVAWNLPICRTEMDTGEAQNYYAKVQQWDKTRILSYRPLDRYELYFIDDSCYDNFYGVMAPSTGCLSVFALVPCGNGLVLMQPDVNNPTRPAPFAPMPKLLRTYAETARWMSILGCENVSDLNALVDNGNLREFIRVNEALQEHRVAQIAQQFVESGARVVLIAGPSSSGKTTFANRLNIALRVHGLRPVKLSLDDYYRNRADLPKEPDGSIDLERLDTLDVALLCEHLPKLLAGEAVEVPEFDFKRGMRMERTHRMQVAPGQPIIIEGIHALNDALTETVARRMKFKIYISALTMLNLDDHSRIRTTDARLLRRIVRDNQFRGTLPEATMAMWASVRRGEERYIFPFQEEADVMFNSSLVYELPIMKKHVFPLLMAVQPESPYYTLARRLVKFLNYIHVADVEDEIPINSILREFIGGNCFYREEE